MTRDVLAYRQGHNGLVGAFYLAGGGLKVKVVETCACHTGTFSL